MSPPSIGSMCVSMPTMMPVIDSTLKGASMCGDRQEQDMACQTTLQCLNSRRMSQGVHELRAILLCCHTTCLLPPSMQKPRGEKPLKCCMLRVCELGEGTVSKGPFKKEGSRVMQQEFARFTSHSLRRAACLARHTHTHQDQRPRQSSSPVKTIGRA